MNDKIILITSYILSIAIALFIDALLVTFLWNSIIIAVLGVKEITAMQALGLVILSNIFFKNGVAIKSIGEDKNNVE